MIQLPALSLDDSPAKRLQKWQDEIDELPTYPDRVAEGKAKFKSRNQKDNVTFNHVKSVLTKMCQGAKRCAYCEDSAADEVEHIQPKDLYPEFVFAWSNYLYACGPCNGPKSSQFAVIAGAGLVEVTRAEGAPVVPPAAGSPALINPRTENPLAFLFLDLLNTFTFTLTDGLSAVDKLRAGYTIKVLRLNDRDHLVDARRTAFGTYRARLVEYNAAKAANASQANLNRHRDELLKVGHQTVWREMQRQHSLYPVLKSLFDAAPEALTW